MLLLGVAVALVSGVGGLPIGGDTTCPSAATVERIVNELTGGAGDGAAAARGHHAVLTQTIAGLLVTLHAADGAVVAERELARSVPCGDLAAAAAVVIASWMGELQSEAELSVTALPAAPVPADKPWVWQLGLAGGAAVTRGSAAPGGVLDVSVGRERAWVHAAAIAFAHAFRERPLGPGIAAWQRSGLGFGPRLAWHGARVWLAADVMGYAASLALEGRRQEVDVRQRAIDVGGFLLARVGVQMGAFAPFVACGVARSLVTRTLEVENGATARLPASEAHIMAGVTLRL